MIANIFATFVVVVGVLGIGWIIWVMRHGDTDRHEEDDARVFFDEHGHWPDETPQEAEAERARLAAASGGPTPPVTQASPEGLV
jgi:hypothetical protein